MTTAERRRNVTDRARRRAVRALARQLGVAYSVAARLLADEHRAWLFAHREQRPFHARVRDTRDAADLPLGRAAHLAARFPRRHTPAGPLYDGRDRQTVLGMLYAVLAHESPELLPARDELAWVADLGEETAVDITCAGLDRAARLLLDEDRWRLWTRIEAMIAAGEASTDQRARQAALVLGRELREVSLRGSMPGVRHILDALLVAPYEGRAPGARIGAATVVGAVWPRSGPPTAYEVRTDGDQTVRRIGAEPADAAQF
jgi:hypothetical protein